MSESRTIVHQDNSYGDCVSCSVYVGDVDGEPDYRPLAFPCPTVRLAELRAKVEALPDIIDITSAFDAYEEGWEACLRAVVALFDAEGKQ